MIVDTHHHWVPLELIQHFERHLDRRFEVQRADGGPGVTQHGIYVGPLLTEDSHDLEGHITAMDAAGVDVAVLHLSVWAEWLTLETARWINDQMAEVVARYPGRFVGLAHVPPLEPTAVDELERAVRSLGLKGLGITSHVADVPLDGAGLRPLLRKADELGIPVVVHGAALPLEHQAFAGHNLARSLGRPQDLISASARLLCTGMLRELPRLRLVLAHLGGGFHGHRHRLQDFYASEQPEFVAHLEQLFFDTAPPRWSSADLRYALDGLGAERVVLGSDYPIHPQGMVQATNAIAGLELPEQVGQRVLGGNAAEIFRLR